MFGLIDFIIVRPLVNLLFVIYNFVGGFGLAIIIVTILVKFLMWPLMKRQLHQTKLMRKIQPQLAEIKKNCNGNRQLESLQMMDLYKRYNIKPFRSFLTTLIQLPIYLALFMSINAMVRPMPAGPTCGNTNVANCAYAPVQELPRIKEIINLQTPYLESNGEEEYSFKPQLFGAVDLSARAGFASLSSIIILIFAITSAILQWYMSKQQMPSGKSQKSRSFRQIMREAADGKEPDQSELNNMVSSQMSFMMPIMMLIIMINLPGALVFYYLLSNIITIIQQKIVLSKVDDEMEIAADKKIIKELKGIKEAEVIENKKTGTHITRISAKDLKKNAKKSNNKSKSSSSGS